MAWAAELMTKKLTQNGGAEVQVDFYDEARKTETRSTRTFNWVPGTTLNQAKNDVIAAGTELKTKYTLFDGLTVGQKIPIP